MVYCVIPKYVGICADLLALQNFKSSCLLAVGVKQLICFQPTYCGWKLVWLFLTFMLSESVWLCWNQAPGSIVAGDSGKNLQI